MRGFRLGNIVSKGLTSWMAEISSSDSSLNSRKSASKSLSSSSLSKSMTAPRSQGLRIPTTSFLALPFYQIQPQVIGGDLTCWGVIGDNCSSTHDCIPYLGLPVQNFPFFVFPLLYSRELIIQMKNENLSKFLFGIGIEIGIKIFLLLKMQQMKCKKRRMGIIKRLIHSFYFHSPILGHFRHSTQTTYCHFTCAEPLV